MRELTHLQVASCLAVGLALVHCAGAQAPAVSGLTPGAPALAVSAPAPALPPVLPAAETESLCPYRRTLLDWWPRKPPPGDAELGLSARVLREFGARLVERGFVLVEDVDQTYWTVNAIARASVQDREMTHGYIRMNAFADFDRKPVRYDFGTRGEKRDSGVLFELPEVFLDEQLRELADGFADRLTPHRERMCADWSAGQRLEEARLEGIRRELAAEIERVRRARQRHEQAKRLELGSGDLP